LKESNIRKFQQSVKNIPMASQSSNSNNIDVDMIDVSHDEKLIENPEQYGNLCVDLHKESSSNENESVFEVEDANKVVPEMEKEGVDMLQSKTPSVTPTKKQKCVNDNKIGSFSPSFFREEDEIVQNAVVTPIAKPGNNEGLVKICEVAKSAEKPINTTEAEHLLTWTKENLRKKLGEYNKIKMERNDQKTLGSAAMNSRNLSKTTSHNNPKVTYDENGLNAMKVSTTITPAKQVIPSKLTPPEVTTNTTRGSHNVPNQIRHTYSARIRLFVGKNQVNVGLILKQMFDVWKEADSSVILLSHVDETNHDMMIDDTNKIPEEENLVKQYVAGLYTNNQRLHFTLRFSGHQELGAMKKKVFSWMGRNRSFTSIDKVKAAVVHTVGFFHHVHPDYYNRDSLKGQIREHIGDWNNGDDINVFPRKMWIMHNGQKVQTRALVIEAPKDNRESINRRMMSFSLNDFPNLIYVPFSHVTDEAYQNVMAEIFFQQNLYLHQTAKKTIYGISNATKKFTTLTGDIMSFQEWIRSITYETREVLEACEVGQNGNIHLIYNQKEEHIVQELFGQDMKQAAKEHFDEVTLTEIFSYEKPRLESTSTYSKEDVDYATFLKRKFASNPQEPTSPTLATTGGTKSYAEASREPPLKRVNQLHFSKFSTPNTIKLNSYDQEPTKMMQPRLSEIQAVLDRLEALEKKAQSQPTPVNWEEEIDKRISDKIGVIRVEIDNQLQEFEHNTNERFKKSEEIIINKFQELQEHTSIELQKKMDNRMNLMEQKFDTFLDQFQTVLHNSTSPMSARMSAVGAGNY